MAQAIESGIGTLNYGKQSAKGTPATAATTTVGYNQPKLVTGELSAKKTYGQEEFIDGSRFASPSMFTDTVGGAVGSPIIQAQPENCGLFYAQILGSDVVTGGSDPYTHTIASSGTAGAWGTWWEKTGASVGPNREMYIDSKVVKLTDECGTQQKVEHLTLDIACLTPSQVFVTDAAKAQDASDPLIWTEMSSSLSFDGTSITDVEGEVLEVDSQLEAWWGDNIFPGQLLEKKGAITRTVNLILTDVSLLKYYLALYGTATPGGGQQPVKAVYYANIQTVYTRSATRTVTKTTPKCAIKPDGLSVGPQAQGGKIPLAMGGACLKSGGTAALTVVALTGDATGY